MAMWFHWAYEMRIPILHKFAQFECLVLLICVYYRSLTRLMFPFYHITFYSNQLESVYNMTQSCINMPFYPLMRAKGIFPRIITILISDLRVLRVWEFYFHFVNPELTTWLLLKMGIKAQQQTNIYKHFGINQQINNTCVIQGNYAKF